MKQKKLKLGVMLFWKNYNRQANLKIVKLADRLGYDSVWLSEAWGYEIFSLLTEMAVHTKNIKLATGIINTFSRSPALIAMHAATLDEISNGRFILGLGASGADVINGLHGRKFEKPLTQLRDVVRVVNTLLDGGKISDSGAVLSEYRPFALEMKPVRNKVPIYVASIKENAIRTIGEMADGWIPLFYPMDELKTGKKWLQEGADKTGRSVDDIAVAPSTIVIPKFGPVDGKKQVRDVLAFYVGGMGGFYKEILTNFGWGKECDEIASLYANKETRSQASDAVTDDMINRLVIYGGVNQCRKELMELQEDGIIDSALINMPTNVSPLMLRGFLTAMAPNRSRAFF